MAKSSDEIQQLLDDKQEKNEEAQGAEKWAPEAGEMLQGIITKTGWFDGGPYEPSLWILVKDIADGETKRVYASTVLLGQLREEMPKMGSGVAIRYEGRKPTQDGSRKYHSWTFALVSDKNGVVHTDENYWKEHGVYRGAAVGAQNASQGVASDASDLSDGDFF